MSKLGLSIALALSACSSNPLNREEDAALDAAASHFIRIEQDLRAGTLDSNEAVKKAVSDIRTELEAVVQEISKKEGAQLIQVDWSIDTRTADQNSGEVAHVDLKTTFVNWELEGHYPTQKSSTYRSVQYSPASGLLWKRLKWANPQIKNRSQVHLLVNWEDQTLLCVESKWNTTAH